MKKKKTEKPTGCHGQMDGRYKYFSLNLLYLLYVMCLFFSFAITQHLKAEFIKF